MSMVYPPPGPGAGILLLLPLAAVSQERINGAPSSLRTLVPTVGRRIRPARGCGNEPESRELSNVRKQHSCSIEWWSGLRWNTRTGSRPAAVTRSGKPAVACSPFRGLTVAAVTRKAARHARTSTTTRSRPLRLGVRACRPSGAARKAEELDPPARRSLRVPEAEGSRARTRSAG